jgi:hypothetical protein
MSIFTALHDAILRLTSSTQEEKQKLLGDVETEIKALLKPLEDEVALLRTRVEAAEAAVHDALTPQPAVTGAPPQPEPAPVA